jgi:hypothetical protein
MFVAPMPGLERRLFGPAAAQRPRRAPTVDGCATIDGGVVAVALANRRLDRPARISVVGLPKRASGALMAVAADELFARNSRQRPDAIGVRTREVTADSQGRCVIELAPAAVGVASFA